MSPIWEKKPDLICDTETRSKWSVYSSSQNLATVLNDPSLPRSLSDNLFTKDWGNHFGDALSITAPSYPRKITSHQLESYCRRLTKRNQAEKRNFKIGLADASKKKAQDNLSSVEEIVPNLFLKSDFCLENTNTFKAIISFSENSSLLELENPSSPNSWSGIVKEAIKDLSRKLTDYLDIVEENLSKQISVRFRDFFHIMNAMDSVMDQLSKTIREVSLVRSKCHQLENTLIKPSLRNIQITKARYNAKLVLEKVKLIATVHQTQPTIQLLLSNSQFVQALDLISTSQDVVYLELEGLHCFRHLNSQLNEIKEIISRMMKEEFIKFISNHWNRPLSEAEPLEIQEEDRFKSIVMGMIKNQDLNFIDQFNKEARMAIKTMIKQTIAETLSKEDDLELGPLSEKNLFERMAEVKFDKWIVYLNLVFVNSNRLLKEIESIHRVMMSVIKEATEKADNSLIVDKDSRHLLLNKNYNKLNITLKESLVAICDDAHTCCRDLVMQRSSDESLDKLTPCQFVELSKSIESFTSFCEETCGRRSNILKSILMTQANRFATRFHEERKRKLNSTLSVEQWKSLDTVSSDFQNIIDQIINEGVKFSEIKRTKCIDTESKYLKVKGENMVIVPSIKVLIMMIIDYCECANEIVFLSPDLLTRLLDLLQFFNTRTGQLVLGCGATHEAGLKSITARNLFISWRCLHLILIILPFIEQNFCDLLPSKYKSMLKHFNEIRLSYLEHIEKIPEKVISLVKDFMMVNLSKWEAKPPVPSLPFQTISQHLMRLHENIQDTLPIEDLSSIFLHIHELFKDVLRTQLVRLKIANDGGPQHG